tara:strand:- start:10133 stop:10306 length:174 start_codon:yes stop_codon:yes gene_type:complete
MAYVILKYSPDNKHVVIVNDAEGISMEFDTYEEADRIAKLFQSNTTHDSKYEVKKYS